MTTPARLQRIDELLLAKHSCLDSEDKCYFFGEYAGRMGFQHSPMNQLIFNFKKPVGHRGQPDWKYKEQAINEIVQMLTGLSGWDKIKTFVWVPMPPSKSKQHPAYDDRLLCVLKKMAMIHPQLDIREVLYCVANRDAAHETVCRPSSEELYNLFQVERAGSTDAENIIIFDDVLTTGAHFRAAKRRLRELYPGARVIGIFIARSVIEYEI